MVSHMELTQFRWHNASLPNANFDTATQISDLATLGDTTVDTGVLDLGAGAELVGFLLNLNSEFTRGGNDQHDRTVARLQVRLQDQINIHMLAHQQMLLRPDGNASEAENHENAKQNGSERAFWISAIVDSTELDRRGRQNVGGVSDAHCNVHRFRISRGVKSMDRSSSDQAVKQWLLYIAICAFD